MLVSARLPFHQAPFLPLELISAVTGGNLRLYQYPFPSQSPVHQAYSLLTTLPESATTVIVAKWRFLFSVIPSTGHLLDGRAFPHFPMFMHIVSQIPSLFDELLSLIIFMLILSQIWQIGAPYK